MQEPARRALPAQADTPTQSPACHGYGMSHEDSSGAGAREWNAGSYDRVGEALTRRGVALLDRLSLGGGETVIDAGCGTGRVTEQLRDLLPDGRVVAIDGSAAMLDVARENLGADRVRYLKCDLEQPLPLEDCCCDAIISTSTLHWVHGHAQLFAEFARVMRPGGALAIDCGGTGNIASVLEALAAAGETWNPWNFAGVEETEQRLSAAGFDQPEVWISRDPVDVPPERLREYLGTVVLGSHLERRDRDDGALLVEQVANALPAPQIDYVRLNVNARRS